MIIGVTYDNENVFQHFGHTEKFKIYEIKEKQIISQEVVDTNGQGHGALAGFLRAYNVNVLICGGIGMGAQNALKAQNIDIYGGIDGKCDDAVVAYINGELPRNINLSCNHHDSINQCGGKHSCC